MELLRRRRSQGRRKTLSAVDLEIMVDLSYSISHPLQKMSHTSAAGIPSAEEQVSDLKLLYLIRFVSRVEVACHTLMETAIRFPSFQKLGITLLQGLNVASAIPSSMAIIFCTHVLKSKQDSLSMMKRRLTQIKARCKKLCAKRLHFHAEVGLLFYLSRADGCILSTVRYIGVS